MPASPYHEFPDWWKKITSCPNHEAVTAFVPAGVLTSNKTGDPPISFVGCQETRFFPLTPLADESQGAARAKAAAVTAMNSVLNSDILLTT